MSGEASPTEPAAPAASRAVQVLAVGVVSLTLLAFGAGLRQAEQRTVAAGPVVPSEVTSAPLSDAPADAPQAVAYAERPASLSLNAGFTSALADLRQREVDPFEPREAGSLADKREALAARAQRRAYAGAPPVIPHQVAARSAASCLACHEDGLQVGDRTASAMPHRLLSNCLQCHAPPPPAALAGRDGAPDSAFAGQEEPVAGERAWPGAPPVIPHGTSMRERCVACHGPTGAAPLRTTHPWRVSCTQCHAASAGFAR